jgi:hypothetical protein
VAVTGADAVLVMVPIEDVVAAIFDAPMLPVSLKTGRGSACCDQLVIP